MHGCYLASERGRIGYLILAVDVREKRGGLGEPIYRLCTLTVEQVPRTEALAQEGKTLYWIKWDGRRRRTRRSSA